jgi:hypothetical protein
MGLAVNLLVHRWFGNVELVWPDAECVGVVFLVQSFESGLWIIALVLCEEPLS